MTDNVKKVFEIIGVEPNERFKLENDATNIIYYITEDLKFVGINESREFNYDDCFRLLLTNKLGNIVKLPKEPKKKKLRNLTEEEFLNWKRNNCGNCKNCIFKNVICTCAGKYESLWVECKYLYSDAFLDQEIEVEE